MLDEEYLLLVKMKNELFIFFGEDLIKTMMLVRNCYVDEDIEEVTSIVVRILR
jgi:hypothetical protein